jgi:formate hydrogenlyase transcriptional activator
VLFFMAAAARAYENLHRELLEQVAGAVAVALDHCLTHEEVRRLRDQLAAENVYLREEIRRDQGFDEIVGRSHALADLLREVEKVAPTHATVLIQGETGTGKELIARAIHERSGRRGRPLVKVNCAAIAAGLFESELFGHVKGAFTGALADRDGRFKLADGGTLFLDEIGELPLDTQVKLLRVLQEQEFEAIGSSQPVKVDVRVIAATNRDLGRAVSEGRFRADLFYRLNVFPMRVPPLRERAGDVPVLVAFFLQRLAKKLGKPVTRVSEESIRRLVRYSWPGNIRELQNVVERAAILAQGPELIVEESLLGGTAAPPEGPRSREMEEVERAHIHATLERTRWVVDGARGAARLLGLHPSTLRSRMKRLGVDRDRSGPATGST